MKTSKTKDAVMFIGNRYTSHLDVFNTPHYRTHKIAQSLSKLYEKVVIVLLDYKTKKFEEKIKNNIHIISIPFTPTTIKFARKQINTTVEKYNINTLIFSNGPLIATSYLLFKKKKYTLVYEVLDNYKTFFSKKLFFLLSFDKYFRNKVNYCLYVSKQLLEKDEKEKIKAKKFLFPNGVDKKTFFKTPQKSARKELGLEKEEKIVGFIGSVDSRVEENLQTICTFLEKRNVKMIVCGHNYEKIKGKNIVLNGFLPSEKVNTVINALSLGIVPNRKDEFTNFCFPSKLMEYMACEIPCLSTPIPSLEEVLPRTCIGSYNMEEFSNTILKILKAEKVNYSKSIVSEYYWENLVSNTYEKIKNAE